MSSNSLFAIAVHTMSTLGYLHHHGVQRVSSSMIAKSVNTNPVVIRRLILLLKKAGLVQSKEGKSGGVFLAKAPSKITLNDIFNAVEVPSLFAPNKKPELKSCPVSCGMKSILPVVFKDVENTVAKSLQGKTLSDIIKQLD